MLECKKKKKKRAKVQPRPPVNIYDLATSEILHVKLAKLRSKAFFFPPPVDLRTELPTNQIPF